jgi:hypothetical protein
MAVTNDTVIVSCETDQSPLPHHQVKANGWAKLCALMLVMWSVFGLSIAWCRFIAQEGSLGQPDAGELYERMQAGQGAVVLRYVALVADRRWGWAPAPGDAIVYAPDLPPVLRAMRSMGDDPPLRCADPRLIYPEGIDVATCIKQHHALERQLRFGPSMFSDPLEGDQRGPRHALDDALATYIEEVGHSWQEYLYETEGLGEGPPTRSTSLEAERHWWQGMEYQVKRYILDLDGNLLSLSDEEHQELRAAICMDEGSANPMGHPVPPYGPPPGWPDPQGWPTSAPTAPELRVLCAATGA